MHIRKNLIDRKIGMVLSFICCVIRNYKEVRALDANLLLDKIIEKGIGINETLAICNKIDDNNITIGDALWIKKVLDLSDNEAVKILLS